MILNNETGVKELINCLYKYNAPYRILFKNNATKYLLSP